MCTYPITCMHAHTHIYIERENTSKRAEWLSVVLEFAIPVLRKQRHNKDQEFRVSLDYNETLSKNENKRLERPGQAPGFPEKQLSHLTWAFGRGTDNTNSWCFWWLPAEVRFSWKRKCIALTHQAASIEKLHSEAGGGELKAALKTSLSQAAKLLCDSGTMIGPRK